MTNDLLRLSLVTASLFSLTACATPYPTRYQTGPAGGIGGTLSADCTSAMRLRWTAGGQQSVAACLTQRAAAWERQASTNRGATRAAGALAILATATGIGLAAEGDPNHAIVPLGLVTGAAVTGARSYASPEQATVAEKAVAAYNCLLSAVAELQAGGNMPAIDKAYSQIAQPEALSAIDVTALRDAGVQRALQAAAQIRALKRGQSRAVQSEVDEVADDTAALAERAINAARRIENARAALKAKRLRLDVAYEQAKSQADQAGARLLRQSDIVDEVAIAEITKREPSVYAVASSARDSIMDVAGRGGLGPPKTKTSDEAAMAPGVEQACDANRNPQACAKRAAAIAAARPTVERLEALAAEAEAQLAAFDAEAAVFDAAVAQSKATDSQLGADCKVAVTEIPVMAANVTELTLSEDREGAVFLTGGVVPYYPDQPPKGWSVIMSPSGRAEIAAPKEASGSTTTLSFYDGAPARNHVNVAVTVPEKKETPAATPPADAAQGGGGAQTSQPSGGPNGNSQ
jgi:hypothetical protein